MKHLLFNLAGFKQSEERPLLFRNIATHSYSVLHLRDSYQLL
jgi:hypothetical protein